MGNFVDLTGRTFGRLSVIKRGTEPGVSPILWVCVCSCGATKLAIGSDLTAGKIKSCGCLKRETSATNGKKRTTHGLRNTRLYKEWTSMKNRCYNEHSASYRDYGGRGISVCEEWRHDFMAFYTWAISAGYDETAPRGECTLDRIDNLGSYSPENCRWVTNREQQNNKRNNRELTINGKTLTVPQWAREIGISPSTLHSRLNNGWSPERALSEPLHTEKSRQ